MFLLIRLSLNLQRLLIALWVRQSQYGKRSVRNSHPHVIGELPRWWTILISYRTQRIGGAYLNMRLIPMLCRKANVPEKDARGTLTSHRALDVTTPA